MTISSAEYTIANQRRRKVEGTAQLGVLGHHTDHSLIDVPGRTGCVYVRFPAGSDTEGYVKYEQATIVHEGIGSAYVKRPDSQVWVARGFTGQLEIKSGDWQELIDIGVSPTLTNPLAPQAALAGTPYSFLPLLSIPVGTAETPGTKVSVGQFFYYDDVTFRAFSGTPRLDDKIDLAPFIPPAGTHRYAVLWLDTYTKAISITYSTYETIFNDMTQARAETHWQECAVLRPADGIPIKAYYLKDNDPYVTELAKHTDLRQQININRPYGFPTTISAYERIQPARQVVVYGELTITGSLEIMGELLIKD